MAVTKQIGRRPARWFKTFVRRTGHPHHATTSTAFTTPDPALRQVPSSSCYPPAREFPLGRVRFLNGPEPDGSVICRATAAVATSPSPGRLDAS